MEDQSLFITWGMEWEGGGGLGGFWLCHDNFT